MLSSFFSLHMLVSMLFDKPGFLEGSVHAKLFSLACILAVNPFNDNLQLEFGDFL